MSYPSNSFTSNGIASGQPSRYVVAPQAIQSTISTHQHNSAQIYKITPGDKLIDSEVEWDAAQAAYSSGQMSTADFDAALKRFLDAGREHDRRVRDFQAREQAGLANPTDYFKEFYGYTDEEAEKFIREGARLMELQIANEARSQSRMVQKSRYRGGR